MKPWNKVVSQARYMSMYRNLFAYLYGANGEKPRSINEATLLVNKLWEMYPEHFEHSVTLAGFSKDELINHIVGKRLYDCSSAVCALTQDETNDFLDLKVVNDYNSTSLSNLLYDVTTPALGCAGSVLWKDGHVAIDTGSGICVDFGNEFVDCRAYPIITGNFKKSGKVKWVDYKGALNV